jgi:hypothetical protein
MDCYGYGRRACAGELGHLDVGLFSVDNGGSAEEFLLRQSDTGTPIVWKGDSGGPCISPTTAEIYGVLRSSDCSGLSDASAISADQFGRTPSNNRCGPSATTSTETASRIRARFASMPPASPT